MFKYWIKLFVLILLRNIWILLRVNEKDELCQAIPAYTIYMSSTSTTKPGYRINLYTKIESQQTKIFLLGIRFILHGSQNEQYRMD